MSYFPPPPTTLNTEAARLKDQQLAEKAARHALLHPEPAPPGRLAKALRRLREALSSK